ncbi:carboxylesterase/lipase family protein [Phaeacidiphilus oryzae]|uniref:carboxylesterase/lipase family protein n=1 Tax=Phaeacidiphilus oryzae TaxID=348818 RepID=UPI000691801C|nr:carboxylesterase family protein [Phaeacidiphilus oryzae]
MQVPTANGRIRGRVRGECAEFLGIPYAAAPYPDHAFAPPRPPEPWDGILDATVPGATAAHPHVAQQLFPDPVVEGRNPLNLNVYAPAHSAGPHPVLVWLPGGGFFSGGNAGPWYSGESFARDGVVLVVPNYRLAAEGFMVLDDGLANRALLDITAALRWVQGEIAAFGGDPGNVTVAGQSAGAMAALALSGCPGARGLFHRLAAMSAGTPLLSSLPRAEALSEDFAALLGTPRSAAALAAVPARKRLELEAAWLPREVQGPAAEPDDRARCARRGSLRWQPTLDGSVLTASPQDALAEPGTVDALMIGTTVEEWNFVLGPVDPAPSIEACRQGFANLGLTGRDLTRYLHALETDNPGHALAQALSDRTFREPARGIAEGAARAGIPTYAYQFAWAAPGLGAAHCADLPFVFDHLDAPGAAGLLGPDAPAHLADALHGALVGFARDGDPGWTAYDPADRRAMVFDEEIREVPDALSRTPARLRRR